MQLNYLTTAEIEVPFEGSHEKAQRNAEILAANAPKMRRALLAILDEAKEPCPALLLEAKMGLIAVMARSALAGI